MYFRLGFDFFFFLQLKTLKLAIYGVPSKWCHHSEQQELTNKENQQTKMFFLFVCFTVIGKHDFFFILAVSV